MVRAEPGCRAQKRQYNWKKECKFSQTEILRFIAENQNGTFDNAIDQLDDLVTRASEKKSVTDTEGALTAQGAGLQIKN